MPAQADTDRRPTREPPGRPRLVRAARFPRAVAAWLGLRLPLGERSLRQSGKGTSAEAARPELCLTLGALVRIPRLGFHLRLPGNRQAISDAEHPQCVF